MAETHIEKSSLDGFGELPNNSLKQKQLDEKEAEKKEPKEPMDIKGKGSVKKRSLAARFREDFGFMGWREVFAYGVMEVFIPGLKDVVVDVIKKGTDMAFYGSTRSSSPSGKRGNSKVSYTSYYEDDRRRPATASMYRSRGRDDYRDIWFEDDKFGSPAKSKEAAEIVLSNMRDTIDQYDFCLIRDLYSFAKIDSTSYLNSSYGWDRLGRADVMRVDGGWVLDLPDPIKRG